MNSFVGNLFSITEERIKNKKVRILNMKKCALMRIVSLILIMVLTFSLTSCGGAASPDTSGEGPSANDNEDSSDQTWTLTFAHNETAAGVLGASMVNWADEVNKATNGRVTINIIAGGALGAESESLERLKGGAADITYVATPLFTGQFPLVDLLMIPAMGIQSTGQGTNVYWDYYEAYPELFDSAEFANFKLLAAICTGTNVMMFNKKVTTVSDLKGLRIRASSGQTSDLLNAVGMSPVSLPPSETYTAAEKKAIDAICLPPVAIPVFRLQEVTPYIIDYPVSVPYSYMLMNKDVWDSFPADIREAIESVSYRKCSVDFSNNIADTIEKQYAVMVTKGELTVIEPSSDFIKVFSDAAEPIKAGWVTDASQKLGVDAQEILDSVTGIIESNTP
jgi:TRAP-type C4-dicarboxylate transport system substrate-binding protein